MVLLVGTRTSSICTAQITSELEDCRFFRFRYYHFQLLIMLTFSGWIGFQWVVNNTVLLTKLTHSFLKTPPSLTGFLKKPLKAPSKMTFLRNLLHLKMNNHQNLRWLHRKTLCQIRQMTHHDPLAMAYTNKHYHKPFPQYLILHKNGLLLLGLPLPLIPPNCGKPTYQLVLALIGMVQFSAAEAWLIALVGQQVAIMPKIIIKMKYRLELIVSSIMQRSRIWWFPLDFLLWWTWIWQQRTWPILY